jgi:hypothetical protein
MAHSPLIHETIEYKHSVPVTTRTFDQCINSRDMKYIGGHTVSSESVDTKVYVYNENISDWEIDRGTIPEYNEISQFKIETHIIFEYRQDKQNLTVNEFDSMTTDLIKELESNNMIIFSRDFVYNTNTIELGVITSCKEIASKLISVNLKDFSNLGVCKIYLRGDDNEQEVVWDGKQKPELPAYT